MKGTAVLALDGELRGHAPGGDGKPPDGGTGTVLDELGEAVVLYPVLLLQGYLSVSLTSLLRKFDREGCAAVPCWGARWPTLR